jgi:hypothetical protein
MFEYTAMLHENENKNTPIIKAIRFAPTSCVCKDIIFVQMKTGYKESGIEVISHYINNL